MHMWLPSSRVSRRSIFWGGQSVSVVCDQGWTYLWAVILVTMLHVSEGVFGLANSLGHVALAVVPVFLTPLFGNFSLFKIMVYLDSLRGLLAFGLAFAIFFNWLSVVWVLVALFVMSSLAGLFHSAFYAVLPDIAGNPERLTRDNARLSVLISAGAVVMPVLAAAMVGVMSAAFVVLIIGIAYMLSAFTLLIVDAAGAREPDSARVDRYLSHLARGIRIVAGDRLVASATILSTAFNCIVGIAATIVPFLILKHWGLSAQLFGFYTAAAAAGGILGGIAAGVLVNRLGLIRSLYFSTAVAGLAIALMGLAAAANASYFAALLALETLVAVATVVFNVANGTLRQVIVPRELLAQTFTTVRVVAALGSAVGAALGGVIAAQGASSVGLSLGGLGVVAGAVVVSRVVQGDPRVVRGDLSEGQSGD